MSTVRAVVLAGALAATAGVTAFVKPWEGRELAPYRDIVGVWTWCDGETQGVRKDAYTHAECDAITANSVTKTLRAVAACIHVPLKENEWIAIGSWSYNVGVSAACSSTLVRKINAGDGPYKWCQQLLRWDRAGGKQVRGLTRRRQAEYKACIGANG